MCERMFEYYSALTGYVITIERVCGTDVFTWSWQSPPIVLLLSLYATLLAVRLCRNTTS